MKYDHLNKRFFPVDGGLTRLEIAIMIMRESPQTNKFPNLLTEYQNDPPHSDVYSLASALTDDFCQGFVNGYVYQEYCEDYVSVLTKEQIPSMSLPDVYYQMIMLYI